MTIPVRTYWIPGGDAGTRAILSKMLDLIRAATLQPPVRQLAMQITTGIAGHDSAALIRALRAWMATYFVFTRDPVSAEGLFVPALQVQDFRTTGAVHGDCDDAAMLAASLGRAIGLRAQLVTVAFQPDAPMAHVYAELAAPGGGGWFQMDVTAPNQGPLPKVVRRWTIPV